MKSFKSYQHQRILMSDGTLAKGDFIIEGEMTVRVKDGYLNDVFDPEGNLLPAISTADGSHIEHWKMGVLHCETEPAVIDNIDNYEEWWLEGKQLPGKPTKAAE